MAELKKDDIGALILDYKNELVFICRYCLKDEDIENLRKENIRTLHDYLMALDEDEDEAERDYACGDCWRIGGSES